MKLQVIAARLVPILFLSLTIYGCGGGSDPAPLGTVDVPVTLSSDFSAHALNNNPTGTGSGPLTLNRDTGALSGAIAITGLTGVATNAHVHVGIAGIDGGTVVDLNFTASVDSAVSVPANTILTEAQMTAMLNAEYYVNVHTTANSGGELRGQIVPAGFQVIRVELDGASEIPPVTTSSSAIGYLTINSNTRSVQGNITSDGIAGDDLAHIHGPAAAGAIAGAIVTFTKNLTDDDAQWTLPDTTMVSQTIMDYIIADQTYLNVHTPGNPNGEIRGQIVP